MVDDTKIVSVKSTLCTPYTVEWPLLDKGETPEILNAIRRTFEPLKTKLGKVKSRGRKSRHHAIQTKEDNLGIDKVKAKQDNLRSQILIGINEVTRGLERGLLRSVIVCRSTKPSHMTNHLFALSATRATPALCLFRLSEVLSPLLNLKTVIAIGFKKTNGENSVFDELVELIIEKTPKLSLPWLQEGKINIENLKIDHPRGPQIKRLAAQETTSETGASVDEGKSDSKPSLQNHPRDPQTNVLAAQETTSKIGGRVDEVKSDSEPSLQNHPQTNVLTAQETTSKIGECVDEVKSDSKPSLQNHPGLSNIEPLLLGVKRPIEDSCSGVHSKQMKHSILPMKAEYKHVKIDKVKVIPKELKSKRRKKKKGKKAKDM